VRVGVFSQDLAQELPLDRPALDYVCERAREADTSITLEKCRQALGALGLTGGMALQTIGSLSGGEKARVALAVFALIPSNLLLLDEASNHLDAATIDVLTGALSKWPGTIIAITHNRSFAESLNATHVLRVKDGTATLSSNLGLTAADFDHGGGGGTSSGGSQAGGSSSSKGGKAAKSNDKKNKQQQSQPKASSSSNGTGSSNGSAAPAARAAPARKRTTLSFKEREEYEKLQREMAAASARQTDLVSRVEKLAAAGAGARADLEAASAELAALATKSEEMELRWLELAELAGDL
jgi:ABC-type multidrug transport system ATPase subunit